VPINPRSSRSAAARSANGRSANGKAAGGSLKLTQQGFEERFELMVSNIATVIRGKDDIIRLSLTALLAHGHVLFEDYPGTGKTMLARAISQTMAASQNRVQCTPDLLPSDITGSPVLDRRSGDFVFRPGPVFANVLLADEINRATPKTQSALLEAMAERRVSVDGVTHSLPRPFFVLATENPVELAGTFGLPEAQLDRFLFKLTLGYANREAEVEVLDASGTSDAIDSITPVVDTPEIIEMIDWAAEVAVAKAIKYYIVDLVQATRQDPALQIGASTRASQALLRAARVVAASQGREDVIPDDVKSLATPVLGHRLILTPDAMLREETVEAVTQRIVNRVKVPLMDSTPRGGGRSKVSQVSPAVPDVEHELAGV
jgi:MoxR-like ATPase